MDRVNAPDSLWFPCVKHLSEIHNLCSDPNLPNEITPFEARRGITPDISAYLQFSFYERVLYLDPEVSWPTTKERSGRWIVVATNVGDHLTYYILDDQSKQILARSVVRPYTYNFRVKWDPSLSPYPSKRTACHGGISCLLQNNVAYRPWIRMTTWNLTPHLISTHPNYRIRNDLKLPLIAANRL